MDWVGCGHCADQATRWQRVSLSLTWKMTFLMQDVQLLLPIGWHNRLHSLPTGYRGTSLFGRPLHDSSNTHLRCPNRLVISRGNQHTGRIWRGAQSRRYCRLPAFRFLRWPRRSVLYYLRRLPTRRLNVVFDFNE